MWERERKNDVFTYLASWLCDQVKTIDEGDVFLATLSYWASPFNFISKASINEPSILSCYLYPILLIHTPSHNFYKNTQITFTLSSSFSNVEQPSTTLHGCIKKNQGKTVKRTKTVKKCESGITC